MSHRGLQLRMAIVGSVLFAFYLALATVAHVVFQLDLALVALGSVGVVGLQYLLGTKLALWSSGAEDMPEEGRYGEVHRTVERLSADLDLQKPRLMVAEMGVPNAFAVGRRGAGTVVVSRELVQLLDDDELEGVLAHELAHIDNRDVLTMTVGQSIAMIAGWAAYFAVLLTSDRSLSNIVLAYAASVLVNLFVMVFVMAISRYREYVADADAAGMIGGGEPLASALEKIDRGAASSREEIDDNVAALCIFGGAGRFLSTHPPTEERIERLRGGV